MKTTGEQLIECVVRRLKEEGETEMYDTKILRKIKSLKSGQLNEIVSFGDVTEWHNERLEKIKGEA